jgi:hypothetical protein
VGSPDASRRRGGAASAIRQPRSVYLPPCDPTACFARSLCPLERCASRDRIGDAAIASVGCAWRRAGRSALPARCAWAPALARLPLSGFSSAMVAVPASTSSLLWLTSDGPSGRGRRCVWAVAQVRVRYRRAPADCCFCVGVALLKGPFGRPGPNHGGFESLPAAWFVRGKRRSRQPSDFPRTFTPGLASTESSRRAQCEA